MLSLLIELLKKSRIATILFAAFFVAVGVWGLSYWGRSLLRYGDAPLNVDCVSGANIAAPRNEPEPWVTMDLAVDCSRVRKPTSTQTYAPATCPSGGLPVEVGLNNRCDAEPRAYTGVLGISDDRQQLKLSTWGGPRNSWLGIFLSIAFMAAAAYFYRTFENHRHKLGAPEEDARSDVRIESASDSALPLPPYKLRASYLVRSVFRVLAVGGFMALCIWLFVRSLLPVAQSIQRERAIWDHGVAAEEAEIEGTDTVRRFVLHDYKLDVMYVESPERMRVGQLAITTLGSRLDMNGAIKVRFDPSDPRRFALSSAIDAAPARWAYVGIAGLIVMLMISGCAFGIVRITRVFGREWSAVRDGVIVEVTLSDHPARSGAQGTTYYYRTEPDDSAVRAATFRGKQKPVFVGDDGRHLLALRSRHDASVVLLLRSDLYPLALSGEQRERFHVEVRR